MVFTWPSQADDFRGNGIYFVRARLKDAAGTTTLATSAPTDQIAAGLTTTFDLSSANVQLSTGTQYRWELEAARTDNGQADLTVLLLDLYGGNPYAGGQAFGTGFGSQSAPTAAEDYRGWTVNIAANAATTATVTTTAPTAITTTGATLGGNVTADGGATVTERGVVYVAGTGTPTTSDTKVVIGSGTGSFALAITGLTAGTQYTTRAYATNSAGTSYGTSQTFTTTAPLTVSISAQTNVLCFGGTTGAATVTATGGTAPYTYLWSNSATTATITGLTAGTYNVMVTDAASRTATASATITEPSALTSSVAVTNVSCFGGSTGAINLTPAGGTAPYTFNWGGGISTEDRTGLAAGTYSVTITDANGCTRTQSATISQPATALSVSVSKTDATSNGAADGTAMATPAGGTPGYTYQWSNGAQTASITGLTAGTYSVVVTDANGCQTSGSATVGQPAPAAQSLTISTGTIGAPVAILAGTYTNVTVTGTGVARLDGPVTVNGAFLVQGSLNTACQALTGPGSFTLAAGATLSICDAAGITVTGSTGAVQLTGTRSFSPEASYVYNGTAAQATGTGLPAQVLNLTSVNPATLTLSQALSIRQVLTLNAGSLATNGRALTLLSDASGTALIANLGAGAVQGSVTVQRYIDGSLNPGLGYRHLAAPVIGATVASFGSGGTTPVVNSAYNASATPGSVTPFPTVFTYNQARLATSPATSLSAFDKGWQSPAALTDPAQLAFQGFTVQLPGASTLSFTGQVGNSSGTIPLSRANGATAADAGWNLIGNPYPAPLDLSTIPAGQRTRMDAAFYTYESTSQYGGSYRSYVNGIGNPLLGSSQAFFVRVSEGQTNGSLSLTNANRVTTYAQQAPVRRGAADSRPQLQLTLAGQGLTDALTVYAQAGATTGFDQEFDAAKLWNPSGLSLATLAASGEALAIDGRPAFPLGQPVPLTVQAPRAGTYSLTATDLLNLPAGTDVVLVDLTAGTRTPLQAGTRYSLTLPAGTTAGRLQLEVAGRALSTSSQLAQQLSVYPNPTDGQVQLVRPAAWGGLQVQVLNSVGQTVQTTRLSAGEQTLDLRTLPVGVYTLRLTTQQGLTLTKRLVRQ
nr:T9SS type A sorting domain-containing protein [Hymenobacter piscis]